MIKKVFTSQSPFTELEIIINAEDKITIIIRNQDDYEEFMVHCFDIEDVQYFIQRTTMLLKEMKDGQTSKE